MATKNTGVSCFDKASPDEPVFVLRAQDILAPELVKEWAHRALIEGTPIEKVKEAMDCAREMEDWQIAHTPKVPD